MKLVLLASLFLAAISCAVEAQAHLLPAQNATLNLIDNRAYLVVSVPVSALAGVDDNSDGRLSGEELDRHKAEIGRQFNQRFQVGSPEGRATTGFTWVVNPQTESAVPPPTSYVVLLAGALFPTKPSSVSIRTDLFGSAVGEGQMSLRARRGEDVEVAILNAASQQHVFFKGPLAIIADFIRVGMEHILLGWDHLLFLLMVVITAKGWRYWATMITSFTVAHSITLSLSIFGAVSVSPSIVEPAIAASIILMAADNLIRKDKVGPERVLFVLGCGLLHGLGFASALGQVGLNPGNRIASLAGFNLGVEAGQILFVAGLLGLSYLVERVGGSRVLKIWQTAASGFAAVTGLVMILGRIGPMFSARG
jgi:hydrogenase/urease accessory protein HupE